MPNSNYNISQGDRVFRLSNTEGEFASVWVRNGALAIEILEEYQPKTELEIYEDIAEFVSAWLSKNGFADFIVQQWAQPSIQGLTTPVVLLDYYDSERYGWTSTKYVWDKDESKGYGVISWRKDLFLSFTFWKDTSDMANPETDLKDYKTALDIANLFLAYLQSDFGREELHKKGYWTIVAPRIHNPNYETDSGKYARFPVIRTKFVIKENITLDETENFITKEQEEEALKQYKNSIIIVGV